VLVADQPKILWQGDPFSCSKTFGKLHVNCGPDVAAKQQLNSIRWHVA
jgi:hypothetical protein